MRRRWLLQHSYPTLLTRCFRHEHARSGFASYRATAGVGSDRPLRAASGSSHQVRGQTGRGTGAGADDVQALASCLRCNNSSGGRAAREGQGRAITRSHVGIQGVKQPVLLRSPHQVQRFEAHVQPVPSSTTGLLPWSSLMLPSYFLFHRIEELTAELENLKRLSAQKQQQDKVCCRCRHLYFAPRVVFDWAGRSA